MILRPVTVLMLLAIPPVRAHSSAQARQTDNGSQDPPHKLHSLFDEEWQYELRTSPETATALGDNRYNDRLSDYSAEFYRKDLEESRKFLARFEAIPTDGLSRQDRLSRELMIRNLREQIEGAQFKSWEMSVSQNGGPQIELPDLITYLESCERLRLIGLWRRFRYRLHQLLTNDTAHGLIAHFYDLRRRAGRYPCTRTSTRTASSASRLAM